MTSTVRYTLIQLGLTLVSAGLSRILQDAFLLVEIPFLKEISASSQQPQNGTRILGTCPYVRWCLSGTPIGVLFSPSSVPGQDRNGREDILNFASYNLFAFPYAAKLHFTLHPEGSPVTSNPEARP